MGGPKKAKKDGRVAFTDVCNFVFHTEEMRCLILGYVESNKLIPSFLFYLVNQITWIKDIINSLFPRFPCILCFSELNLK
jgi:hypothetical protein